MSESQVKVTNLDNGIRVVSDTMNSVAVSYTHLTLPTNREV